MLAQAIGKLINSHCFHGLLASASYMRSAISNHNAAPTTYRRILIAVFVFVTIVVAVFPVTMVTVMFTVFVPFSFFAAIPLTIVPLITVMLVPFAVVSARYGNGELLR